MLELAEELLPMGANEWETLSARFNSSMPNNPPRDYDSLRRKYKTLKGAKKPTGDPDMHPHIALAKCIQVLIDQRAGSLEMDDDDIDDYDSQKDLTNIENENPPMFTNGEDLRFSDDDEVCVTS